MPQSHRRPRGDIHGISNADTASTGSSTGRRSRRYEPPLAAQQAFLAQQAELRRQQEELNQRAHELNQREDEVERKASMLPGTGTAPSPPTKAMTIEAQALRLESELERPDPQPAPRIAILPAPAEQYVERESKELEEEEQRLAQTYGLIQLLEKLAIANPAAGVNLDLEQQRQGYLRERKHLEEKKRMIKKASATASKYRATFEMPEYTLPPDGFRRDRHATEMRNVKKIISPGFNPALYPNQQLKHVWAQVLQYGREQYLNESEYIKILGCVLSGDPLETYSKGISKKHSLKRIMEDLTNLYDVSETYADIKKAIDGFARLPNEPIRKAITRYSYLMDKTSHMYSDTQWVELLEINTISMIKQLIAPNTRFHVETEELRIKRAGGTMSIESYLTTVEEFESIRDIIPKKAVAATFQTASMAPAISAYEAHENAQQLKALKTQMFDANNVSEIITTAVNAAMKRQYEDMMGQAQARDASKAEAESDPKKPTREGQQPNNQHRADALTQWMAQIGQTPLLPTPAPPRAPAPPNTAEPAVPGPMVMSDIGPIILNNPDSNNPAGQNSGNQQQRYNNNQPNQNRGNYNNQNYNNNNRGNYNNNRGNNYNNNNRGNNNPNYNNRNYQQNPNRKPLMKMEGQIYARCYPCNGSYHVVGTPCPQGHAYEAEALAELDPNILAFNDDDESAQNPNQSEN